MLGQGKRKRRGFAQLALSSFDCSIRGWFFLLVLGLCAEFLGLEGGWFLDVFG
jgi:hypothetical protein